MTRDNKLPKGFEDPIARPDQADDNGAWQQRNRSWWEGNPMRYDWRSPLAPPAFSREFYEEIDKRFFDDAACYMPPSNLPFDELVPYATLSTQDVLEIGIGSGSHAQLLAPRCQSYTGVDLTEYAVTSTRRRFELYGIKGDILQMDAESMAFAGNSFDYIWTWGVIHHSADTGRVLGEMRRVLRPGGTATVMVYHRSFLYYYIFSGLFRGVLAGGFLKARSLHELVQRHTDGAIARFYRPAEWKELVEANGLQITGLCIKGQKSEIFPIPASRLKTVVMSAVPSAVNRLVLNRWGQGSFLITTLRKP